MKFKRDPEKEKKGLRKFFYMMRLRWTHGMIPSWYDFKRGIKNLRRWFPHVWKYADWDGHYTIDLLIASLEFQRKRLQNFSREIEENLLPKIELLTTAIDLLKKCQDESNYHDSIDAHFDAIYGEDEMYFEPFKKTQEDRDAMGEYDDESDTLYRMRSTREDKLGKEEYEKYSTERKIMRDAANAQLEADRKKAFEIIAGHIPTWWE